MPRRRRVGDGVLQMTLTAAQSASGRRRSILRPLVVWAAGDPPRRGCVDDDNKGPARVAVRREGGRERWKMAR